MTDPLTWRASGATALTKPTTNNGMRPIKKGRDPHVLFYTCRLRSTELMAVNGFAKSLSETPANRRSERHANRDPRRCGNVNVHHGCGLSCTNGCRVFIGRGYSRANFSSAWHAVIQLTVKLFCRFRWQAGAKSGRNAEGKSRGTHPKSIAGIEGCLLRRD